MQLKHDLNDIAALAIMNHEPIVIVEGKDDRQIYQLLLKETAVNGEVYQVNEFENYGPGCDNVIACMVVLQPKFDERPENIEYLLGIIDRDVRPYRALRTDEIDYSQLRGLFVLKHYSIETYFATRSNLKQLIAKMTTMLPEEIPAQVCDLVEENVENSLANLYLISLEALKNACVEDYENVVGYKQEGASRRVTELGAQNYLIDQISPKRADLEAFANSTQISLSFQDIKKICKGKWYLYNFVYRGNSKINELAQACRTNVFNQCRSCRIGNTQDCCYVLKARYRGDSIEYLYHDMLSFIDKEECQDILDRLNQLAHNG